MTAEEKTSVAFFIDLASDMARGGYSRGEREYKWLECTPAAHSGAHVASVSSPLVMVICDTPSEDAPDAGEEAGLLDKMLASIGLSPESNCFIASVNDYEARMRSLKPRFILCLGEKASQTLLHSAEPFAKLRGKFTDFILDGAAIPLIATYHPGDLLRNGGLKRFAWDDLKLLRARWSAAAPESAVNGAMGGAT